MQSGCRMPWFLFIFHGRFSKTLRYFLWTVLFFTSKLKCERKFARCPNCFFSLHPQNWHCLDQQDLPPTYFKITINRTLGEPCRGNNFTRFMNYIVTAPWNRWFCFNWNEPDGRKLAQSDNRQHRDSSKNHPFSLKQKWQEQSISPIVPADLF